MSMANSIKIKYHGEVLCCFDQTEVKAVEPYSYFKWPPKNIFRRIRDWMYVFLTGKRVQSPAESVEVFTKVMFKDGTYLKIRMPFLEFVNDYC